jgi:hypothetical protein
VHNVMWFSLLWYGPLRCEHLDASYSSPMFSNLRRSMILRGSSWTCWRSMPPWRPCRDYSYDRHRSGVR